MQHLPISIYLTFGATVLLSIGLFYKATHHSRFFITGMLIYIAIQSVLGISGFYSGPATGTARFPLLVAPPLLFLVSRFFTEKGRAFLDMLDLPALTLVHIVRIPVELTLFGLFLHQAVPEAMTFHGRNLDILSGITAPLIYYFGFVKMKLNKWLIIIWNISTFLLLLNVVSSAVLSLPARFHQFGFEQPNTALGYFPFVLLPACWCRWWYWPPLQPSGYF